MVPLSITTSSIFLSLHVESELLKTKILLKDCLFKLLAEWNDEPNDSWQQCVTNCLLTNSMRIYPHRRLGIGQDMRNECTCGHCQLAHVKRESNTARVYKVQLPPIKIKNAKVQPKKTVPPKLIYGYQNATKKKKLKKPVHKSVVRSKPEYDAWYFSDADLHTIAHSNMENYLSRFQPELQEVGTQTSATHVRPPKPAKLAKVPSEDKAVQISFSDKEVKNSFNKHHRDRGDSPTRRNSPVALSALMNYKQASGDFNLRNPPLNLHFNRNLTRKNQVKSNLEPASEKIILLPPKPQSNDPGSKEPQFQTVSDFDELFKSHRTDIKSNTTKPLHLTDFDDFKAPLTKLFHSGSKNRIKELLDSERYRHPEVDDVNHKKQTHRQKYDKKHKPYKIESCAKISRKLLETSLKHEKEARKLLKVENDGLKNCISKAEQKVRDMRVSLAELSNTIRTYKTKLGLPYVTRVEKLEKLVDELIREFRSSSKAKTEVCNSPKIPALNNQKDIHANYVAISAGPQHKDKNKGSEPKNVFADRFDQKEAPIFEDENLEKFNWSNLSSISSGIVSRTTASSATTSLTALKKELGKFFENMRDDTEKLIEEAQLHHEALLSYSERTSSVPSYDSTSTVST